MRTSQKNAAFRSPSAAKIKKPAVRTTQKKFPLGSRGANPVYFEALQKRTISVGAGLCSARGMNRFHADFMQIRNIERADRVVGPYKFLSIGPAANRPTHAERRPARTAPCLIQGAFVPPEGTGQGCSYRCRTAAAARAARPASFRVPDGPE